MASIDGQVASVVEQVASVVEQVTAMDEQVAASARRISVLEEAQELSTSAARLVRASSSGSRGDLMEALQVGRGSGELAAGCRVAACIQGPWCVLLPSLAGGWAHGVRGLNVGSGLHHPCRPPFHRATCWRSSRSCRPRWRPWAPASDRACPARWACGHLLLGGRPTGGGPRFRCCAWRRCVLRCCCVSPWSPCLFGFDPARSARRWQAQPARLGAAWRSGWPPGRTCRRCRSRWACSEAGFAGVVRRRLRGVCNKQALACSLDAFEYRMAAHQPTLVPLPSFAQVNSKVSREDVERMLRAYKAAAAPPPAPATEPNGPGGWNMQSGVPCLAASALKLCQASRLLPADMHAHANHRVSTLCPLQPPACASAASAATLRCSPLCLRQRLALVLVPPLRQRTPLTCGTHSCLWCHQHAMPLSPGQPPAHWGQSRRQWGWRLWASQQASLPACRPLAAQLARCQLCSRPRREAGGNPLELLPAWAPLPGGQPAGGGSAPLCSAVLRCAVRPSGNAQRLSVSSMRAPPTILRSWVHRMSRGQASGGNSSQADEAASPSHAWMAAGSSIQQDSTVAALSVGGISRPVTGMPPAAGGVGGEGGEAVLPLGGKIGVQWEQRRGTSELSEAGIRDEPATGGTGAGADELSPLGGSKSSLPALPQSPGGRIKAGRPATASPGRSGGAVGVQRRGSPAL